MTTTLKNIGTGSVSFQVPVDKRGKQRPMNPLVHIPAGGSVEVETATYRKIAKAVERYKVTGNLLVSSAGEGGAEATA